MSDKALALLARESRDYPYFIQLLGSAAWDAAAGPDGRGVGQEAAERGIALARREMEQFYAERFAEAEERGVRGALRPLASLFKTQSGQVSDTEIQTLLHRIATPRQGAGSWTSLRTSLLDLGILWEASPGVWEMGIPSFAQHVLRRGKTTPSAPVTPGGPAA